MASFRAFTFALDEQNRPIQNSVSEVLTGNETLINQNPAAFNQVAQKYLSSTEGIEPREVGKHQKFVLLTTEKCRAELKLDIVLKLKPLEQSDPLYFGLNLNGEVTARPTLFQEYVDHKSIFLIASYTNCNRGKIFIPSSTLIYVFMTRSLKYVHRHSLKYGIKIFTRLQLV